MPSDTQQPPPATNPAPTTSLDSIAPATIYIAPAVMADLDALVALENMCFVSDRLTRRQFRYMLQRAQSVTLVARLERRLIGYVSVLFKRATSVARLYSIAVAAEARRMGVARALVAAAEQAAWVRERDYLRLEIRHDNLASQRLFERLGYRRCGIVANYYADRMTALRYEKMLVPELGQVPTRVPFYEQPLDFTCGASALMIAMKRLAPELMLDRALTLRIRREATTIFVTSEYGGCGPFGLALAAHRRGFDAEVFVNDLGVPLIGTVRGPEKKARMRWVHENMLAEIQHRQIPVTYGTLSLDELATRCAAGAVPLVLISSYRIYAEKMPHWVVMTGHDRGFVLVHDPYADDTYSMTRLEARSMPIRIDAFRHMVRYGRAGLQTAVLISRSANTGPARDRPHDG